MEAQKEVKASMQSTPTRTDSLSVLRQANVPRGVSTTHPIFAARTEDARLWDVNGDEYIDFTGGIGVLNVGHNHPHVIEAVKAQLERFTHTCFQVVMYEPYIRLAERLNRLAPGSAAKKTILLTTGAEAVENAVKIARASTNRPAIVAFAHGFHGRTLMGMSLTGQDAPYKQNFGPFAPEIYHTPYPYEYRGWSTERALAALQELFETQVAPERVAAVIIEPVLGEGGFVPAPVRFLRELRRITAQHGILLIADEIQTGFGRTGTLFAIEHAGVEPDLLTAAKSLAGGFPLSAVIGRADVMDAPAPGGLGGTYAGNPVACAAALAVLDIFEREDLLGRARRLGLLLETRFRAWLQRYPIIGDVRVTGAMAGLELVRDRTTREPATAETALLIAQCREQGLLLLKAGAENNVIRTLMPLTIPEDLLETGLAALEAGIAHVSGG